MVLKKLVLLALAVPCFVPAANAASMELLICSGRLSAGDNIICRRKAQSTDQRYASLLDLYEEGWRLIATQTQHLDMGNPRPAYPYVFFLERPKGDK